MSEILDAVNGEGPYAKDKGEISTTAPHGNTLDSIQKSAVNQVPSSELLDAARDVVASAEHIDGDAHKTLVCVDALTRLAAASNG